MCETGRGIESLKLASYKKKQEPKKKKTTTIFNEQITVNCNSHPCQLTVNPSMPVNS
jgi:hypothetical protein